MGNTTTNSSLRPELWRKKLFADIRDVLFMKKFIGSTETSMIQEMTDLKKGPGSKINFGLGMKLSGSGVTGDNELEGNEESMTDYEEEVAIDQLRHAVRLKGRMDEQKSAYKMRSSAKIRLQDWFAERMDQEIMDKLCGKTSSTFGNTPTAPAATRTVWAGGQSATTDLTAAMKMDTKVLDAAKQMAKLASPRVKGLRIDGKERFVAILHPYQITDLKQDPVYNQAQRDANVRGEKNPIFSGAVGMYNGIVIHEHEYVYAWAGGDSSAPVCRAVLCGQQAAVIAYGNGKVAGGKWTEKSFDYGNKWGIAVGSIFGIIKPMFNSLDYGVISMETAGTTASTA